MFNSTLALILIVVNVTYLKDVIKERIPVITTVIINPKFPNNLVMRNRKIVNIIKIKRYISIFICHLLIYDNYNIFFEYTKAFLNVLKNVTY